MLCNIDVQRKTRKKITKSMMTVISKFNLGCITRFFRLLTTTTPTPLKPVVILLSITTLVFTHIAFLNHFLNGVSFDDRPYHWGINNAIKEVNVISFSTDATTVCTLPSKSNYRP